ncbi:hypothetical protein B0H14DRAFT_3642576 [Mycena olivaceomarginata]|nr:hypothetical protein B0H14DRAFT_3642576 [Mycena olivaceomarginata]
MICESAKDSDVSQLHCPHIGSHVDESWRVMHTSQKYCQIPLKVPHSWEVYGFRKRDGRYLWLENFGESQFDTSQLWMCAEKLRDSVLRVETSADFERAESISSGFDLEAKAYCKTNGLPNFETKFPPYEEMYFKLLGLSNTLSLFHIDITMTWIYNRGPGGKFWIRSRPHPGANLETHDYEVTALPPGSGIFLQQPGRRHAVIGTDTEHAPYAATLTIGGYFLCASRIRSAIGVIMHIVMLPHLLTNAEHVFLWQIYIRIAMFWLHITEDRSHEQEDLKGYLPNLSLSSGWLDIIYLACMVELLPCLDHRNYGGPGTPECEVREASAVCAKYAKWRKWLAQTHSCDKIGGKALKWERDIFSPCLLNMALALSQYHGRVALTEPTAEIFHHFTHSTFQSRLRTAPRSYNAALVAEFDSQISTSQRSNFFLFKGNEFIISVVK